MRLFLEAGRIDENGLSSSGPEDKEDALDMGGECSALYGGECTLEM